MPIITPLRNPPPQGGREQTELGANMTALAAKRDAIFAANRAVGPDSTIGVKLDVAAGATLAWLPQETILFDRARLARSIEIDLAPDAQLFLAEAIVFGRSGMGEAVEEGVLADCWRVRRGGK